MKLIYLIKFILLYEEDNFDCELLNEIKEKIKL